MISHAEIYFLCIAAVALAGVYLVSRGRLPLLPACIAFFSVFAVELEMEHSFVESGERQARLEATRQLNAIGNRLTGLLQSQFAVGEGLAAYIATQPDIAPDNFAAFADNLLLRQPLLINLAAAPDLVVTMVHPLPGNEAALGLDYREHAAQLPAVLRARDERQPVLAGPVNLVQGGRAFIVRLPVYVANEAGVERFWGIVSATIDAAALFDAAGLDAAGAGLEVAIRGQDGLGTQGAVFFGPQSLFNGTGMIDMVIPVASGEWVLAGHYPEHAGLASGVWFLRCLALLLAVGWIVVLEQRLRARKTRRFYEQALHANEQLMQEAGKLARVGGWKLNETAKLVHYSQQFAEILGLPLNELLTRRRVLSALSEEYRTMLSNAIDACIERAEPLDLELAVTVGEKVQWLHVIGNPIVQQGRVVELVGAIQDVTERMEFIQKIEEQATRDGLTGLPNRNQFDAFLAQAVADAARRGERVAVLFIDLDEFKSVNDNLGHSGGDQMLIEAAERIKSCTRKCDVVARLSGDEFAVILSPIGSSNAASVVAAKIVAVMNQPFEIQSRQIFSSVSVGVAIYPDDGADAETLMINADQAMYEVKKSIRNDFTVFTRELHQRSEARHRLFNRLSLAVKQNRLGVHSQPIEPLIEGGHISCEALVRWSDEGRRIPPDEFIPLAEDTGLITQIDRFALAEATRYIQSLRAAGIEPPALSVNVSPRIFFDRGGELASWVEHVQACARHADLTLEVTERLLTQDTPHAMVVLEKLRASGVKIAIDDFGTGYSSLSYLARFPVDSLKIDAFFIGRIPHDSSAVMLTESILSLGQKLSLNLVAEGVETAQQYHYLKANGCHAVQGYWVSPPLAPADFTRWLAARGAGPTRVRGVAALGPGKPV